jgi:MFS family permease
MWTTYAIAGAVGPIVMGKVFDAAGSYRMLLSRLALFILLPLLSCFSCHGIEAHRSPGGLPRTHYRRSLEIDLASSTLVARRIKVTVMNRSPSLSSVNVPIVGRTLAEAPVGFVGHGVDAGSIDPTIVKVE